MTFVAPVWLALAVVVAAGVVALHLISTRRPPPSPFPTARFVPEGDARAVTRTARPSDLILLAARMAAVLLLGAAFAQPVVRAGRRAARVLLVDRSRSTLADIRDSATAVWRAGDVLVVFDSSARRIGGAEADSLRGLSPVGERGVLSAGLVAAARAAFEVAPRGDSLELLVVSPVTVDEIDAATAPLLARWRGRVRFVRTGAARTTLTSATLASADSNDGLRPMVAQLAAVGRRPPAEMPTRSPATGSTAASPAASPAFTAASAVGSVRIVRTPPSAPDSTAARQGAAVVYWPAGGGQTPSAAGVWAGNATAVAPLSTATGPLSADDSGAAILISPGRVIARWADGRTAAVESPLGQGCLRSVNIGVPLAGDVFLQPAFAAVSRRLLGLCTGAGAEQAANDSVMQQLLGSAVAQPPAGRAAGTSQLVQSGLASPISPWLAGAALLLLLAELLLRRPLGAVRA